MFDGWVADYDENGDMDTFTFQNMTMIQDDDATGRKGVEVTAVLPDELLGFSGKI